jgi:hypothetical protein
VTLSRIGILGLLTLGIVLRLVNLDGITSRTPDERTYAHQSNVALDHGAAGLSALAAEYRADPAVRMYPTPSRVGFIQLNAATMALTGRRDVDVLPALSCLASILSLAVLTLIGMRFLPPGALLVALLFAAVSPLELPIARRAWADAVAGLIAISMAYVTCEIIEKPRLPRLILLAGLAAAGVSVKELSAATSAICVLWLIWWLGVQHRDWKKVAVLVGAMAAAAVITVSLLASVTGGITNYFETVFDGAHAISMSPYELEYASGPPWLLLYGFWILTPVVTLLSVPGFFAAFRGSVATRWIAFFVLAHIAIPAAVPHWLNLRYVTAVSGPLCLIAGLGVWQVLVWCRDAKVVTGAAVAILAIAAWTDYQRFQRIFVRDGTPDLAIKFLINER